MNKATMNTPKLSKLTFLAVAILTALSALAVVAQDRVLAQDAVTGRPFLRRDLSYHVWYYDGRDDRRDFPTNGFFPGDFAADPSHAAIGAAGLFGSTPEYAPSRLAYGSYQAYCARRYRSYDPATGYFLGHDGAPHRCR
jgi:hypothetical protein